MGFFCKVLSLVGCRWAELSCLRVIAIEKVSQHANKTIKLIMLPFLLNIYVIFLVFKDMLAAIELLI